jgi:3-phosphoshikimate 1-carboxyvinyltransferase
MDLTDCPDLFPPLAALAAFGQTASILKGIHRLTNKESNRAETIQSEWGQLGIRVELKPDEDVMVVHPGPIHGGRINSHGDHRLAMAGALFGAAGAPVEIVGAECVAKSYPAFFDDLEALGVSIHTVAT